MNQEIKKLIQDRAKAIGFSDVRFADIKPLLESEQKFLEWRAKGYAADMQYLLKADPINARPEFLLEDAQTLIMFTANYYSKAPSRPSSKHGRIAAYAVGLDYHKVLRNKLKELTEDPELKNLLKKSKFFTDAVPLLEKSFAIKAGLGFRGKNTLLISRETGSFNFILEIITDLKVEADSEPSYAAQGTCGGCIRCSEVCPTDALPNPYQLDARRCISYHTIENRGEIPQELAKNFGEWFFGCDLCQTVCPYNKKAEKNGTMASFAEFSPEAGFGHWFYLPEILDLDTNTRQNKNQLIEKLESHKFIDKQALPQIKKYLEKQNELNEEVYDRIFQIKFARTPLLRPKRKGLIRNAKICLQDHD